MKTALEITLPQVDLEAIRPVAEAVRLTAIRCRGIGAKLVDDDLPDSQRFVLTPKVTFETQYRIGSQSEIRVRIDAALHGSRKIDGEPQAAVEVDVSFELVYAIRKGSPTLSDNAIEGFARVNGLYNAWPYIREAFQSCTTRLGLPPYTLELLRIPSRQVDPLDSSGDDGGSKQS